MLIRFIGSPGSGKTTVAAKVFAHLKETSWACDFVTEYARHHIAKIKFYHPQNPVLLTDEDQCEIMSQQNLLDRVFSESCGPNCIIITDTCPLNALFYMSKEYRSEALVKIETKRCTDKPSLYFYSPPIKELSVSDPNRVHSKEISMEVDKQIPQILAEFAPEIKVHPLVGTADQRMTQVLTQIYGM